MLGGNFNGTIDPLMDWRGEEPQPCSAGVLRDLVAGNDLIDAWRVKHPNKKLFMRMKAGPDWVGAACLDRVYILTQSSLSLLGCWKMPNKALLSAGQRMFHNRAEDSD